MKKYVIGIDGSGAAEMLKGVLKFQKELEEKSTLLCQKLAERGAEVAKIGFSQAVYDGPNDTEISVEGEGLSYTVKANGEAVLFIEFGTGITYSGQNHPEPHGMVPGTWSEGPMGKGHWNDPNGWYIPKERGGGKTYGNPPNAAMFNAAETLRQTIADTVREVFG